MKEKLKLYLPAFLVNFFTKGAARSVKVKKNILYSFAIRSFNILISFLLVPLTINYVNPTQYGIWLTLSSIVAWFSFFDIGFGNGLRNKFAEAVAVGDHHLARVYVSTTYTILCSLIGLALLLFLVINPLLDWAKILNTTPDMSGELNTLALLVFSFFCVQFILQLIAVVLTANQEPARAAMFKFYANVLSLLLIYLLTKTTSGNLLYLGIALGVAPILVLAVATIVLYSNSYRAYAPSFKLVNLKYGRNLMGIGIKFFILQVGAVILFQTNNIIITQLFGPTEVTTYQIPFRYFGAALLIFNIIMTPFWSAFTEAWIKKDMVWIQNIMRKLRLAYVALVVAVTILLIFCGPLYRIWIGDSVTVPFSLSIVVALSIILQMWQSIFIQFVNGISKVSLQLWLVVITSLINIPLAIYLGKQFGIEGVAASSVILFLVFGIFMFIQSNRLINGTAHGIWNK